MHDAKRVFSRSMHRTVNGEAGGIDGIRRFHHDVAGQIYLYKAGRSDLVEHHAVRIKQEVMFRSGNTGRDVRED